MTRISNAHLFFSLFLCCVGIGSWSGQVQADDGKEISFKKQVAPILAAKCLGCHGPDRQDNDFRVDDLTIMAEKLSGGDLEGSKLWTESLSEEADYLMPPEDQNNPLTAEEREVFRQWILTGASLDTIDDWQALLVTEEELAASDDVATLVWILIGRLHPAALHFPIALLTVAAVFAVLAFGNTHMEKAAIYCLFLGMLGAWLAAISGWNFTSFSSWKEDTALQAQHRWGGIGVAALSTIVFGLAFFLRMRPSRGQWLWKVGVLLVAALVGYVGHIGGKIHYKQDIYEGPLKRLQSALSAAKGQPQAPVEVEGKLEANTDQTLNDSQKPAVDNKPEDSKNDSNSAADSDANSDDKANSSATEIQSEAKTESVEISDDNSGEE